MTKDPATFGWPWTWPSGTGWFAPARLDQPINAGWTFGNVVVNTANSSAPGLEQDIVARHSYGRQIGRIMDAVCALADALPAVAGDERMREFRALADDVAQIKRRATAQRVERLREELEQIKRDDPAAWARLSDLWRAG